MCVLANQLIVSRLMTAFLPRVSVTTVAANCNVWYCCGHYYPHRQRSSSDSSEFSFILQLGYSSITDPRDELVLTLGGHLKVYFLPQLATGQFRYSELTSVYLSLRCSMSPTRRRILPRRCLMSLVISNGC